MPFLKRRRGGAPDLDHARALEAESHGHTEAGRDDQAVAAAEQALVIRHALLHADDPERVPALRTLAYALLVADRGDDALGYLGESIRILDHLDGAADPRLVPDLHVVASLLQQAGHAEAAWPYLERFVALVRAQHDEPHEGYAAAVSDLCYHYAQTSQIGAAGALMDEHMPRLASILEEESAAFWRLLGLLAFTLEANGRYREGQDVAERLVSLSLRRFGERSSDHISSLGRLASLRRALRDPAGTRVVAQQMVQLCEVTTELSGELQASALWQLAESDLEVGQLDEAEGHFRRAIALFRALPEPDDNLAAALNGLGNLYAQSGHLAKASELLEEAHALRAGQYGERSLLCGQILSDLAALQLTGGHPVEAERMMRESVEILRESVGEAHPAYARSLHDLGVIQHELGDNALARNTYEQALAALRATLGDDHLLVANHLQTLGNLNTETGNFAEAEVQLTRALEMMRGALHVSNAKRRTTTLSLATLYAVAGRSAEAIALTQEALTGELEMTCQLFAISSEQQRTQLLASGTALDPLLTLVTRHALHDAPTVRAAFEHVLRRKGMGVEALSAQRDVLYGGKHPLQAEALASLRVLRERIARHALAGPGPEGAATHAQQLADWESERHEAEIALSRDIPEVALSARLHIADLEAVSASLPPGSALIDYVQFEPSEFGGGPPAPTRLAAFVLPAGSGVQVQLFDLGEAEPISARVGALRQSVTGTSDTRAVERDDPDVEAADDRAGEALRVALLDPLRRAFGDRRRLFISPDGALHRLPFEILPLPGGGRVIDDYTISYLGAGRDVLRFGVARSGMATGPVVIADPDYDLAAGQAPAAMAAPEGQPIARSRALQHAGLSFARLPGTRTEGEQVAELLGATGYFGHAAVERAIKGCRSPRILHIATHGFFLPHRPPETETGVARRLAGRLANPMLRSGLALAGANTWLANGALPQGAEDALLNGEDVSGLDLIATDLVVLSACESGLGDVQAGEGVYGLRRAFVLAGAATLVVSLWPVPDRQTQELMQDFYRRLQAGTPRAEALRESQRALKARFPHPRAWGAFICVGEAGPLMTVTTSV